MPPELAPTVPKAGLSVPSGTPGPVAAAVGLGYGALSALRGRRFFHPFGVGYSATLRVSRTPGYPGVPLLEEANEHRAVCRFSRATGLPEPLPDILGLALRLPDLHAPGRHQDFLLATGAKGTVLRNLLLPGVGGFAGQSFSSILPYRFGGRVRLVGAHADAAPGPLRTLGALQEAAEQGRLRFRVALAPLRGGWQDVATLELERRLPDEDTEELAFTPWHTGGGIRPAGPFQGIRQPAYRGSQRGRGLRGAQIP